MGKYEAVWIVGVDCDGCRQPDMFVVSMRKDSSYERVTDLTDEEHEKFLAARSVEAQDVDRIRAFLRDFKGDFGSIFGSDQAKD